VATDSAFSINRQNDVYRMMERSGQKIAADDRAFGICTDPSSFFLHHFA